MTKLLGIILIVAGICIGLYAGIWWAFIGGIMDVVHAVRADVLVAGNIFIGIGKVCFAGLIGWATAALAFIPGIALLNK